MKREEKIEVILIGEEHKDSSYLTEVENLIKEQFKTHDVVILALEQDFPTTQKVLTNKFGKKWEIYKEEIESKGTRRSDRAGQFKNLNHCLRLLNRMENLE